MAASLPSPDRYAAKLLLAGFLDQAESMRLTPGRRCQLVRFGKRRLAGNRPVKAEEFRHLLEGLTTEEQRQRYEEKGWLEFPYALPDWGTCRIVLTWREDREIMEVEFPAQSGGASSGGETDSPEGAGTPVPLPSLDPTRSAGAALEIPRADAEAEGRLKKGAKRRRA